MRGDGISAVDRPEPLADLTTEQRIEWILVVNSLPADFFPAHSHNVLAQYCRHAVACRHVSQMIERLESADMIDIDDYNKLLGMQERESRVLVSLATKMRITQQATILPDKVRPATVIKPPWEN